MMMGFQIVRDGYLARAGDDERELLGGLARDLIFILGSDLDQELQIRARAQEEYRTQEESRAQEETEISATEADADDLFRSLEQEMSNLFEQIEEEVANGEEENSFADLIAPEVHEEFFDDALARLLPDMSEDPQEATELRELTADSIAHAKIQNLVTFYQGI
ncbi:MAG: DUF2017 family protein, partial [Arcanobacterium sp.]|nr:DUF2017 family protein [Arcanobacterium sp.]